MVQSNQSSLLNLGCWLSEAQSSPRGCWTSGSHSIEPIVATQLRKWKCAKAEWLCMAPGVTARLLGRCPLTHYSFHALSHVCKCRLMIIACWGELCIVNLGSTTHMLWSYWLRLWRRQSKFTKVQKLHAKPRCGFALQQEADFVFASSLTENGGESEARVRHCYICICVTMPC